MGCLYEIVGPGGKRYLGITNFDLNKRFEEHKKDARRKPGSILQFAIRKHGIENFTAKELVRADGWPYLCELEKLAIKTFNTRAPFGYNATDGGDGASGFPESIRAKHRRMTRKGTALSWQRSDCRERHLAARRSPSFRSNAAQKMKANWLDPLYRDNQIKRLRTAQLRIRQKTSAQMQAKWLDPEYRAAAVARRQNRSPRTIESRERQSVKMKRLIRKRKKAGTYWDAAIKAGAIKALPTRIAAVRRSWENPERRAKQKAAFASPALRHKIAKAITAVMARPGVREMISQRLKSAWQDPIKRARMLAGQRAAARAKAAA